MATLTRTNITVDGSAAAGQPSRLILSDATGWVWPADLGADCHNCYFEHNGEVIPHWYNDTRRSRLVVWLQSPRAIHPGDTITLVSGGIRPKKKPRPSDVGLAGGFNSAEPLTIGIERTPRQIVVPNTTPTGAPEPTYWNMVPRIWRMASGKIGMVCMGGASGEQVAPKYIIFAQSTDYEGRKWGTPKLLVANQGGDPYLNVSAAYARDGKDYVVITAGAVWEPKVLAYITESANDGVTWSNPVSIWGITIVGTGGNNSGVQLSSKWGNKWLFSNHIANGGYRCFVNVCDPAVDVTVWTQYLLCADDPTGSITPQEPAVVELYDGRLLALIRTKTGYLYRSICETVGDFTSWSPLQPTNIPNPNSKPDMFTFADGRIGLITNWNTKDPAGSMGYRRDLVLAISSDNGNTFPDIVGIDGVQNRSAQYASGLETSEGGALVVYAGVASANADHRTIFAQTLSRAEVNTPQCVFSTSGGGIHRTNKGVRRRLANEGFKILPKVLDGNNWPVYVACQVKQMVDYPRENVIVVYQHSAGDAGDSLRWVVAIGGDGNPNGWQWKFNPYKADYLNTGVSAVIGAEHTLELYITDYTLDTTTNVYKSRYYAVINGTRVPAGMDLRWGHNDEALPLQVVFGSPNYGSFPDNRGATMANGNYQDYICGVVCVNPAFLAGTVS